MEIFARKFINFNLNKKLFILQDFGECCKGRTGQRGGTELLLSPRQLLKAAGLCRRVGPSGGIKSHLPAGGSSRFIFKLLVLKSGFIFTLSF